jgi:hypothetical protein
MQNYSQILRQLYFVVNMQNYSQIQAIKYSNEAKNHIQWIHEKVTISHATKKKKVKSSALKLAKHATNNTKLLTNTSNKIFQWSKNHIQWSLEKVTISHATKKKKSQELCTEALRTRTNNAIVCTNNISRMVVALSSGTIQPAKLVA